MTRFLSPFRVLDLTDEKGYFCSAILGALGAAVTRLEKPEQKRDWWWYAYNDRKSIVPIDLAREREVFLRHVQGADFLIESFPPGYLAELGLGYQTLARINPRLIMTSLTPFGQSGPYSTYNVSDLELMALSGITYLIGDADRAPLRIGFPQAYQIASAEAAVATMIAHVSREATGQGQQVDVSIQESLQTVMMHAPQGWKWSRMNEERTGLYRLGVNGAMYLHPMIWKCRDGHVAFMLQGGMQGYHSNRALINYMEQEGDCPDVIKAIKWEHYHLVNVPCEELAVVWDAFARFFRRHTTREIYGIALRERVQLFPVNTLQDILDDEQLAARNAWRDIRIPGHAKTVRIPGDMARTVLGPETVAGGSSRECEINGQSLPFFDLRVADFSWVAAGPWISQWLAEYGAEIIKIESTIRPDATRINGPHKDGKPGLNRSAQYLLYNGGKKSITLNLNHPRARPIALELAAHSDIVLESFSPGKMYEWGLGYEEIIKVNPGIIMLSSSMMGATGPHAAQPGLGLQLGSLAGFTSVTGWPDRDPVYVWGAYTDVLASRLGGATLFAALDHRRRTGQGCYIDFSQFEGALHFIAPFLLEYQATGEHPVRQGNRSRDAAPHSVFPCRGENRWCALSVFTDEEWETFCGVIEKPEWIRDARFASLTARKQNEEALETMIASWTQRLSAEEVMERLQKAGIQSGIVAACSDLYRDPQLAHRAHFVTHLHPEVGKYDYFRSGFRLEKIEPVLRRAPLLGEHNEDIYQGMLGMGEEEYAAIREAGVLK